MQPALQEPDKVLVTKTQQSKWRPSEKFFEMERKEPDGHDNFFASLNQLILSLEPAIKEAGSVAAAEDILTHLEATDENFHKWVCHIFNISRSFNLMCFLFAKVYIETVIPWWHLLQRPLKIMNQFG